MTVHGAEKSVDGCEVRGIQLGDLALPVPVILAPMAGITNAPYRQLCREQAELGSGGIRPAGIFTCEMITATGVAHRIPKTLAMMKPDPGDGIYSVQLYGVEPAVIAQAVAVAGELGVRHIDLNFGCPVPKVTRKGGGGVLPWKLDRFAAILEAAVKAAAPYGIAVTLKTRLGIDAGHETFLDAGRLAQETGLAAITLHARTVAQAYGGAADWPRIAELVQAVSIPVLGNGDVWEVADACRLLAETGCAGVMIGRGCLGRPWLFRDLASWFTGGVDGRSAATGSPIKGDSSPDPSPDSDPGRVRWGDAAAVEDRIVSTQSDLPNGSGSPTQCSPTQGGPVRTTTHPNLGEVIAMVRRHAELLVEHYGDEKHALSDLRKHMSWYFKGFPLGGDLRYQLGLVSAIADIDRLTAGLDPNLPYPDDAQDSPRGRQGGPRAKVVMPYGWLDSRTLDGADLADEAAVSGG